MSVEALEISLRCHPASTCDALAGIDVRVRHTVGRVALTYCLRGELERVQLPAPVPAARRDGLWHHTCCEAFIAQPAGPGYVEWNFAPSGEWAAYAFEGYRSGMAPLPTAEAPAIALRRGPRELTLETIVPVAHAAPARARLALAVVVEECTGRISYWAAHHAPGRPDFHHPQNFALEI